MRSPVERRRGAEWRCRGAGVQRCGPEVRSRGAEQRRGKARQGAARRGVPMMSPTRSSGSGDLRKMLSRSAKSTCKGMLGGVGSCKGL
eukprot:scaffold8043_cov61-Phaeocystis_antarctica.AAC.2